MELLLWPIFAYGVCNILIFGSNFEWWRNLLKWFGTGGYSMHKLFTCMMCLPTWVGFFMSYMAQKYLSLNTPALYYGIENIWIAVLVDGIITSACVWLMHTAQEALERVGN
jgi:hypothetical protein